MAQYQSPAHVADVVRPSRPAFCLRPHAVRKAARWFTANFPGRCLYAVKANPSRWMIELLRDEGMSFDVASIEEARLVRSLAPDAMIGFMHPMKAPEAIAEAYHSLGVRIFSLDTVGELNKILDVTGGADDLTLCVRLAVASEHSRISLSSKFGAAGEEAVELLRLTRQAASRLGVCFHVGSQSMSPSAYERALDKAEAAVIEAGVIVDVVDVGGGFPAPYPGMAAPPLEQYVAAIDWRFERMLVAENAELWCEPGRALSAEGASLIVRVEGRKGDRLYINDGVYGALFDAGTLDWPYPVRLLKGDQGPTEVVGYSFCGPTCDDHDVMKGPFHLPADIAVGDYIEVGILGAYGAAMTTRFNGFGAHEEFLVADAPMMSAYDDQPAAPAVRVARRRLRSDEHHG
ncbi:MAG: type III PLP-dependent enzyme [Alphaproteobacteria bacterium]|nr:type III PLP-dependent enzyme [Alphaproteobacteria bacterium]